MITDRLLDGYRKDEDGASRPVSPAVESQIKDASKDNYALAGFFYVVVSALCAFQNIIFKLLFISYPQMTMYQLLAYRGLFSTILNFLMVNWRAREVLWDSIPEGCGVQLLIRVAQGNISIFIAFYSIR